MEKKDFGTRKEFIEFVKLLGVIVHEGEVFYYRRIKIDLSTIATEYFMREFTNQLYLSGCEEGAESVRKDLRNLLGIKEV